MAAQVLNLVAPSVKGVLVTAGGRGAGYAFRSLYNREFLSGYVPVLKVDVQDTTGAGDAFLAGFLYGFMKVPPSSACCRPDFYGAGVELVLSLQGIQCLVVSCLLGKQLCK